MDILNTILTAIEPQLIEVCALVATAFIGWVCTILRTHLKVQIEEKHERALKKAAATGAKSAARAGLKGLQAMTHIEKHILESVPDAVAYHKPTPKTFVNIIEGALDDREGMVPQPLADAAVDAEADAAGKLASRLGGAL